MPLMPTQVQLFAANVRQLGMQLALIGRHAQATLLRRGHLVVRLGTEVRRVHMLLESWRELVLRYSLQVLHVLVQLSYGVRNKGMDGRGL